MVYRVPAVEQTSDGVHGEDGLPGGAGPHQLGGGTLPHRTHDTLHSGFVPVSNYSSVSYLEYSHLFRTRIRPLKEKGK